MCAKAIDIGTSFLVGAEIKEGREIFTTERDAFFSMPKEDFVEEMLDDAGAYYLTKGNQIFVVGEDALKFSMLTGKEQSFRRPMARGVLNPGEEEAVSMIETLIEGILGGASTPGELVAATVPPEPVEGDFDTTFHRIVIERCLRRLGYEVKIINEALAVIYSENPVVESEGKAIPFTGVGISFGAGMTNLVVAWRAKTLFTLSLGRGGDWIDERVARVRGITPSRVTAIKEKRFRLDRVRSDNPIEVALEIYYEDLIRYTLRSFTEQFRKTKSVIEDPLEIILAGGTAVVPGFLEKFEAFRRELPFPFPIKGVRLARAPLNCVAAGALVAALSTEKKRFKAAEPKKNAPKKATALPSALPSGVIPEEEEALEVAPQAKKGS